ncbi:hypothetical protein C2G38_798981 [Gigaspora rosea]|uniref:F-box domain-containing protein n=1 Tax=Gigaspora rosea TaxID=44941 RepID=A0A397VMM2_9GLOM|nr:hypothetical protein C2G38_798981 [Gigaspora rosea]
MASKILMGDMPELMENIFNNLKNEPNSLYSCALVSRHWCEMSIPILWQDPFSFNKKPLFISEYFSSLDEDEIYILKEYGINLKISRKLFNYGKFLKELNLTNLESKAREWTKLNLVKLISSKTYFDALVNVVINLLLKLLFESGAVLHKLDLSFSESFEFKPEIFYSIGRNELLFSRLQHLSLFVMSKIFNIENISIFLKVLAKNITTISSLNLVIYSDFEPRLFHSLYHAIIRIIKSQEQLKRFILDGVDHPTEFYGIISALECQKNSLQEIVIIRCAYNKEFEVLKDCKNLETLRIWYCSSKLLNLLDCKISTLDVIDCPIDVQTIPLILKNSGLLLQRLSFEPKNFGDIHEVVFFLEAIKSFCTNITYLNIKHIEFSTQLLELIGNLQKLQFLSLCCYVDNDIPEEELEIRVMQFAEILPLTLQYLDLGDNWQPCIDILLSHCNAPLKKLLIYCLNDEKHTRALIEFCIRNKALNYVGICKYSDLDENFRKEVEAHVVNVALVPSARIVVNF